MEGVIFLRKSQLGEEGVWEEPQGLGATGWTFSRLSRVRTVSWEGWPCSENSYGEEGSTAKTGQGRSKPEALECAVAFHQVLLSDQPDGIPERAYLRMLLRPPTADGEVVNWSLGDRLANPLLWGMLKSRRRKECQITQKATDCSERAGKQAYQCLPSVAQTST